MEEVDYELRFKGEKRSHNLFPTFDHRLDVGYISDLYKLVSEVICLSFYLVTCGIVPYFIWCIPNI